MKQRHINITKPTTQIIKNNKTHINIKHKLKPYNKQTIRQKHQHKICPPRRNSS